nr:fimbrillin family protein [uncultured Bacteroides sp.]
MNETSIINSIKHLPAVAIGLLLIAACTKENEEAEIRPMPLTFSLADVQTRGEALTTDNVTSVGVFAFFSQGEFNANTATPSFMYNQKVERTDNTSPWTYSPIKYWPNNVKDKISFFAYAPHSNEITNSELTMSGNTDKGYPWLTFTNTTAQTDFLLSEPLINKDNTETCISFKLKHVLAKVSFYVKNEDTTPGKKIHSFSVHSRQSGKYTFNETGFVYSAATTTMREYAITTVPVDIPENITDKVLLETLFIHPDKETNFSLTYSINGNDANKIEIASQKVPATPDLVSGANINYTITINNDGYTITASNEKEWAQGSENKITYYAADDLKIGDYYYSDGTWSDGGVRTIVNGVVQDYTPSPLESGKTVIGLVFYAGRHPQDNGEYKDKNGNSMEVRGYVVNKTEGTDRHQNGGGTDFGTYKSTTDFNGYFNTEKLQAISAGYNDMMTYVRSLTNSPQTTSGWFLPSIGQLIHIKKNYKQVILKSFQICGGGMGAGWQHYYWSSTEVNANSSYNINWDTNDWNNPGASGKTKNSGAMVRTVLAF